MAVSATSRNIRASWDAIECIERNGLITYTVELSGRAMVVMKQTFTASGLTPYTEYTFKVAGTNVAGIGPFSDTMYITTAEDGNDSINMSTLPKLFLL